MGYATVKREGNSGRRILLRAFREVSLCQAIGSRVNAFNGSQGKGEGDSSWTHLALVHMSSMEVVSSP